MEPIAYRLNVRQWARGQFGERGIMDIIGIIGYSDITSMTLVTMQAGAPNDSGPPLPVLSK